MHDIYIYMYVYIYIYAVLVDLGNVHHGKLLFDVREVGLKEPLGILQWDLGWRMLPVDMDMELPIPPISFSNLTW